MSDNLDLINEYKEQVRILKQEVAELQDAGKSKDSANKRCLQKLEHSQQDLDQANKKITDLDQEIEKKVIDDRQKDYGNYQENFVLLAEMFTLILFDNLKKRIKPHQVGQLMMGLKLYRSTKNFKADNYLDLSVYNKMTREIHKKEVAKKDKNE